MTKTRAENVGHSTGSVNADLRIAPHLVHASNGSSVFLVALLPDVPLHLKTSHRLLCFLIGRGVVPGHEGCRVARGRCLRRKGTKLARGELKEERRRSFCHGVIAFGGGLASRTSRDSTSETATYIEQSLKGVEPMAELDDYRQKSLDSLLMGATERLPY